MYSYLLINFADLNMTSLSVA